MSQRLLTKEDDGKSIKLRPGDTVQIKLNENPTTGFQWQVEKYDAKIIALQASEYVKPAGSALGAGGVRIMTFETKSAGSTELALTLRRSWQGGESDDVRYSVIIQVGD